MKNKNIWIINHYAIPPSLGGLSRHYFFAKELEKDGNKVHIFSASAVHNTDINFIDEQDKSIFKEVEVDGREYTFVKCASYKNNGMSRIKNMLEFMFNVPKIRKIYGYEKPDLIYISSPDLLTAYNALKLARKMKLPCVVEIRDLWPLSLVQYKGISDKNPIIVGLYQLEKWIYKKADAIVFTMPGGKDYIVDKKWEKKISLDKIFNVNNGIDLEEQDIQRQNYTLEDKDLDDDSFKVIYAGSIRTANAVDKLVKAGEVLKDYPNIKLLLYGDGDSRPELEQYCQEHNLTNIVFKGKVEKKYIPYILSKAGATIISVKQTSVGKYGVSWNKLFDYMSAGKPIISTIKVNYDLIEKSQCGIVLDDQDINSIAKAILEIYNLPKEEYDQMCNNAKECVKEYDYKILTQKLVDVMEYAINNPVKGQRRK